MQLEEKRAAGEVKKEKAARRDQERVAGESREEKMRREHLEEKRTVQLEK